MMQRTHKGQAALDLLIAYGIAILVISIAIYVVLQLGVFNTRLAPQYCNSAPSFICEGYAINTTGVFTFVLAQSTGGTMNITGIACSSSANATTGGPQYGNKKVVSYNSAPSFYPTNQLKNGLLVYSSNQTKITVYCYSGAGRASGQLGNTYSGFIWFNYTFSNLPSNFINSQQVISFTAKYT